MFEQIETHAVGFEPKAFVAGDLNGDAILDLAVLSHNHVDILFGNGDGTFKSGLRIPTPNNQESHIAIGDINRDGIADLVIAHYYGECLSVLLGEGNGKFIMHPYVFPAPYGQLAIAVAPFRRNGDLEIAITMDDDTVGILFRNDDGGFRRPLLYQTDPNPIAIEAGDINGDGAIDLVVANYGSGIYGSLSIMVNDGDAHFDIRNDYEMEGQPIGMRLGDFNNDGMLDVAILLARNGMIRILLGNGTGTFQHTGDVSAGLRAKTLDLGDFNGDGNLDLIVMHENGTVGILTGNGDGTFGDVVIHQTGGEPFEIAVGDFDGDNLPDLAVVEYEKDTVRILLNRL